MTDLELLRQYVQTRSEPAFADLVRRHIDWVHLAALRQVRHHQLADDVTQAVFIALAQQAVKLLRAGRPLFPCTQSAPPTMLSDHKTSSVGQ